MPDGYPDEETSYGRRASSRNRASSQLRGQGPKTQPPGHGPDRTHGRTTVQDRPAGGAFPPDYDHTAGAQDTPTSTNAVPVSPGLPRGTGPGSTGPGSTGPSSARPGATGPDPTRPAGLRTARGGRRRQRRLLAAIGLTAALLGGGAAVLANQNQEPTNRTETDATGVTGAGGAPADAPGAGGPADTPGGVAGLGAAAKATPSPSAGPGKGSEGAGFQPFAAPRRTLPGASLHLRKGESFGDALRRSDREFGPLRMVRVFYPGLPPSWNGSRADIVNRTVVVSFKAHPREITSGRHDAKLTAWFASIPRDVDVYWAYFHEPENDVQRKSFTPQQFAAAFKHVSGLADKARNPRLRATLILMCWTLNPNSGRDFDGYYPGSAAVDVLGWDCYNSGRSSHYTGPDPIFSAAIRKSQQLGKPWGIAETGSVRVSSDSSGAGRAAWIRQVSEYLNARKPLWIAYYDYQVSGGDYRLLDKLSQQAWKAFCSAS